MTSSILSGKYGRHQAVNRDVLIRDGWVEAQKGSVDSCKASEGNIDLSIWTLEAEQYIGAPGG